jgi:hypothetical protein
MKYLYYKLNSLISGLRILLSILIFIFFFYIFIIIQYQLVANVFAFVFTTLYGRGLW